MDEIFDFSQFEQIITGFAADIELKFGKLIPNIPVYFMQNGDTAYYYDKKFTNKLVATKPEEVYQKIPRCVLIVDENIQDSDEEKTNMNNVYNYKHNDEVYACDVCFVPKKISISCNVVSSNFLEYLKNVQKISTIIEYPNVYTYSYIGNNYTVQYQKSNRSAEKPSMDFGNTTRNFNMKVEFDLNFAIDVPRTDTIKKISDAYIKGVQVDITSKGTVDKTYSFNTL